MTRIIPTAALIALAGPALAHPGHADGPAHWLALDHLAMLGAMVAIAGGMLWRNRARVRVRDDKDRGRDT